jgi:hypothetical protein
MHEYGIRIHVHERTICATKTYIQMYTNAHIYARIMYLCVTLRKNCEFAFVWACAWAWGRCLCTCAIRLQNEKLVFLSLA